MWMDVFSGSSSVTLCNDAAPQLATSRHFISSMRRVLGRHGFYSFPASRADGDACARCIWALSAQRAL